MTRSAAWDDLGGTADNVRPIRPRPTPAPPPDHAFRAGDEPRPEPTDQGRQIIAGIRRQLRHEETP